MVAINYNNFLIISEYISPNIDVVTVDERLDEISEVIKSNKWSGILLAGDFNSKSPVWGGNTWNARGKILLEYVLSESLSPIYTVGGNTCIKGNGSKIDLLITSTNLCYKVTTSEVLDEFTGSDHLYLWHEVNLENPEIDKTKSIRNKNKKTKNRGNKRMNRSTIDSNKYVNKFLEKHGDRENNRYSINQTVNDIKKVLEDMQKIGSNCTKRNPLRPGRCPVHWWTPEIAEQRKATNKLRRKVTRLRRKKEKELSELAEREFKLAKKELNKKIRNSRKETVEKLIKTIDNDMWGEALQNDN
ncbi:uncharacterized protein LOC143306828 [Osmia lignaria lignaria]|uniref:uncharacterized protein LOC143306828 n=1 Tax=Osmia lignaria lignaria TaxID=1437193 RepID=UPI00402B3080